MTKNEKLTAQWMAQSTKILEKDFPDIFRTFYPRRFAAPATHYSPKHMAGSYAGLASSLSERDLGERIKRDWTLNCVVIIAARLGFLKMPTYWITREFCEVMMEAQPPSDMKISELEWPLDGFNIMLPLNTLRDPSGSPLQWISVVKSIPGMQMQIGQKSGTGKHTIESQLSGLAFCAYTAAGCYYAQSAPADEAITAPALYDIKYGENFDELVDAESKPVTPEEDNIFSARLTGLIANILMYMMAARDSEGVFVARHESTLERPAKPSKGWDELWAPAWIGRDYKHPHDCQHLGGTHASPRTHWRRSHYRQQVHGPGRSLRKTIFVPRKLVNAAPEEQNSQA